MSKEATSKGQGKSTDASVANQFTQQDIPGMLKKVTERINALKKGSAEKVKTTGELGDFGKIKDIKKVDTLIKAYSSVTNRAKAYDEAAKEILPTGVSKPVFKIEGSTAAEWKSDIEKRIVEVGFQQELDKLNKVKKTLEENLSAEAKLANDLKKIAGFLTEEVE